jgi:1,4-alpha-glucan branching enzyme
VPHAGTWYEVLNSDAAAYCGSGVGNLGRAHATNTPLHGQSAALEFTLPPLAMILFTDEPYDLHAPAITGVAHARH